MYGKTEIVKLILDFSQENDAIDLNARDNERMTGFHLACKNGRTETAKLNLENWKQFKIDIKATNNEGKTSLDFLHQSCSPEMNDVKTMLEEDCSKNL